MSLNRELMLRYQPADEIAPYGSDDTIFYALSIGLGDDPLDPRRLRFVCEQDLVAFPTMAFVLGWTSVLGNPEFGIERGKQVVAGLGIDMHRRLPAEGRLLARHRIRSVTDAGKGALIRVERALSTETGDPVATVDTDIFVRGAGGFAPGERGMERPPATPATAPDAVCDLATAPSLALLYRLNGDRNPLHADPEFAKKVGFERPILHGQASFAVAVHALVRTLTDYDVRRLRSIRGRLVRPFYPGQTLRTEIWTAQTPIRFRCSAADTAAVVIDHGTAVIDP